MSAADDMGAILAFTEKERRIALAERFAVALAGGGDYDMGWSPRMIVDEAFGLADAFLSRAAQERAGKEDA